MIAIPKLFFVFTVTGTCLSLAAHAESFVAPSSGTLYIQCVGGSAGAVSQFGTGTSPTTFVGYLNSLPQSCPTSEVSIGPVTAGQTVVFGIKTGRVKSKGVFFTNGAELKPSGGVADEVVDCTEHVVPRPACPRSLRKRMIRRQTARGIHEQAVVVANVCPHFSAVPVRLPVPTPHRNGVASSHEKLELFIDFHDQRTIAFAGPKFQGCVLGSLVSIGAELGERFIGTAHLPARRKFLSALSRPVQNNSKQSGIRIRKTPA